MSTNIDTMRRSETALISALQTAGANVSNPRSMRCPFHEDKSPSAGIYQVDGAWKFKCQAAGCGFQGDVFDVLSRATNRNLNDVIREEANHGSPPPPSRRGSASTAPGEKPAKVWPNLDAYVASMPTATDVYQYINPENGVLEMFVVRYMVGDKKHFAQGHAVAGGVVAKAPPKPWPIYNRGQLATASEVLIVEGEKCAHALIDLGFVATTSPGGAGKASHADWSWLAGKTCWLWPDADRVDPKTGQRTGIKHMREVARILETIDPPVTTRWIDCDSLNLPDKGDAADLIEREGDGAATTIRRIMTEAESLGASSEVDAEIRDEISGRRVAIDFPWPDVSKATLALLPKSLTLVCGSPGSAKSFWMMQCMSAWTDEGIPVAILQLEENRAYHLRRVVAMRARKPAFNDPLWVRNNPTEARAIVDEHRQHIDALGRSVFDWEKEPPTLEAVAQWIDARAIEGRRVIVVDPITAVGSKTARSWEEERAFVMLAKNIAAVHECSIVLVTHPKPGVKTPGSMIESLAGSQAYARFASCILWMRHHNPPEQFNVVKSTIGGPLHQSVSADRTTYIVKARNGPGTQSRIAWSFSGNGLSFHELGVVQPSDDD